MVRAYYNDTDPKACAWLGELANRRLIAAGRIDDRSITEITGNDLEGYERVHLFAGIGGWDYALQLAGWDGPVWTGSCPCQPFSSAGKRKGAEDERHLWPEMFRLIRECRPGVVFGEQVASAVGHGWLDGVFADLEGEGYACGAVVLGAHSVGAPHIRQRLYWVADRQHAGLEGATGTFVQGGESRSARGGSTGRLEHAEHGRPPEQEQGQEPRRAGASGRLGDASLGGLAISGDAAQPGSGGHAVGSGRSGLGGLGLADVKGRSRQSLGLLGSGVQGHWSAYDLIPCRDGKSRRVEPGTFPLAHGVPARVGRLRGYGNAIVPQVAAEFVRALMEARQ